MFIENVLKIKNEWWRYLIGCIVVFIATQIGTIPFVIAILSKVGINGASQIDQSSMMTALDDSNLTLFYFLLVYVFGFLGLLLVVKYIHNQTFISLTTSRKKIDFLKIRTSFLVACFIVITTTLISYLISPQDYIYNFELKPFLILSLIVIVLIPIQTSWEEYIFRGYLMQCLGGIVRNKWIPLLTTSLLFGFLHYSLASPLAVFLLRYSLHAKMLFAEREHSDASPGPWPSHPRVRLPARWPAAPASLPRLLPGAQVALAGSSLRALCECVLPALSLHSDTPSHPNDGGWVRWPQISCDRARTYSSLPPQAPTVLPPPKNSLRSR